MCNGPSGGVTIRLGVEAQARSPTPKQATQGWSPGTGRRHPVGRRVLAFLLFAIGVGICSPAHARGISGGRTSGGLRRRQRHRSEDGRTGKRRASVKIRRGGSEHVSVEVSADVQLPFVGHGCSPSRRAQLLRRNRSEPTAVWGLWGPGIGDDPWLSAPMVCLVLLWWASALTEFASARARGSGSRPICASSSRAPLVVRWLPAGAEIAEGK